MKKVYIHLQKNVNTPNIFKKKGAIKVLTTVLTMPPACPSLPDGHMEPYRSI